MFIKFPPIRNGTRLEINFFCLPSVSSVSHESSIEFWWKKFERGANRGSKLINIFSCRREKIPSVIAIQLFKISAVPKAMTTNMYRKKWMWNVGIKIQAFCFLRVSLKKILNEKRLGWHGESEREAFNRIIGMLYSLSRKIVLN